MKDYRPDIDGLRAVAVLPVLLFHAGVPGFSGGFVGVDVFFVISGFLITGIIARDVDAGRFSILRFYERRFRRLLAALFTVLAVTTVLAFPVLSPAQMEQHGEQLVATSLFSSNLYFSQMEDYFAPAAEELLLLHTWSLAVEEQFYLFFPLALIALGARSRVRTPLFVAVFFGSLGLAEYGAHASPSLAFYMLPTRAWELLTGSLLALGLVPRFESRGAREATAWLGLAAIGASVVLYSGKTPFPGLSACLPVLGAGALIHAGSSGTTSAGELLSRRSPVFIGQISYSLYLWHWPLLLLARFYVDGGLTPPSPVGQAAALLLSFPLSIASWKWVEGPFRTAAASRGRVFGASFAGSAAVAVIGVVLWRLDGVPARWPAESIASTPPMKCFKQDDERAACRLGESGHPTVALWGDSHAHAMMPAFQRLASTQGWSGVTRFKNGCPPLAGVWREGKEDCRAFNDAVLDELAASDSIQTVIVAGRWTATSEETRPEKPDEAELQHLQDGGPVDGRTAFRQGLAARCTG